VPLETGRQHQIRIHRRELGHPLWASASTSATTRAEIESPRPMLHARSLGFVHPRTGKPMSFEREPPADFDAMLQRLGV
jgi:23S rRNA pseudouridine1911/1915/1917 synthase